MPIQYPLILLRAKVLAKLKKVDPAFTCIWTLFIGRQSKARSCQATLQLASFLQLC